MKLSLFSAALAAALLSATGFAQTNIATAHIPFAFQVGETTLPAGNYMVQDSNNVLRVFARGGSGVFRLTMNAYRDHKTPDARMVFKRYGGAYYLTDIWNAGATDGFTLVPGKRQKTLAIRFPTVAMADVRLVSATH